MSESKLREIYIDLWNAYCRESDPAKRKAYADMYCFVKNYCVELYGDK